MQKILTANEARKLTKLARQPEYTLLVDIMRRIENACENGFDHIEDTRANSCGPSKETSELLRQAGYTVNDYRYSDTWSVSWNAD